MVVTSLVLSVPLAAADDGVVVTETGEALAAAGELVADPALLAETGDGYVATTVGIEVELPVDPADPLTIAGAASELGIELPQVAGLDEGVVDESGAVVYESDSAPVSLAAQATVDGGMQVLMVLDGPDAPDEYRFDLALPQGASVVTHPDGAVEIVDGDGEAIGLFEAPWAVDAAGHSLETAYVVDGHTLVQTIDLAGATYPVVADPAYFQDCGWVTCTRWVNVAVSKAINDHRTGSATAAWALIGVVKCGALALATGAGGFVCAVWDGWLVLDMNKAIENAALNRGCIKWKWSRQLGQGYPTDWDWTTPARTSKCTKN
jgi:hypothetical protein